MINLLRIGAGMCVVLFFFGFFRNSGNYSETPYAQHDRPNILFIYTDDQAPWAMSLAGQDQLHTPHMDRIGQEGAYFSNFFTPTPVCSPARASLLTSRYGTETGITDWIKTHNRGLSLAGPEPDHGLDPAFVTWPELLQQAGYATGLVGKWHLGELDKFHPTRQGYDYFMGFRGGGTKVTNPTLEREGTQREIKGFTTEILTNHALDFIKAHQEELFLLSLHYRAPHSPWLPLAEEDWEPYKDLTIQFPHPDYPDLDKSKLRKGTREYFGSVASVDRQIGRILNLLDSLQLSENTIVVFTSDHGYNMGHNGMWRKGNGQWILTNPPAGTENIPEPQRPNMYDNSLRVPTVIRWPAKIKSGTVVKETISTLDWYPSLLAMADVDKPDTITTHGRNFLPLLLNQKIPDWNNDFYAQYSTHHQSLTEMRMYRTSGWKLLRDFKNPERDELYYLKQDPEETTNLIKEEKYQQVIQQLHEKIIAKMHETNDPVVNRTIRQTRFNRKSP
jgi:choline-sulfatase